MTEALTILSVSNIANIFVVSTNLSIIQLESMGTYKGGIFALPTKDARKCHTLR